MCHWGGITQTHLTADTEAIPIGVVFLIQVGSMKVEIFLNFTDAAERLSL